MNTAKPFHQRSLREAAKAGATPKRAAIVATPAASEPPPIPKPPKPAASAGMVRYQCGHEKPVAAFQCGVCAECRDVAHRNKIARRRAREEARRAADDHRRLPDGSVFGPLIYDAAKREWSGLLEIVMGPELADRRTFSATASGVFRLLRNLDAMYRASLPAVVAPEMPVGG